MAKENELAYELSRVGTAAGVGWFSCVPAEPKRFEEALGYLEDHPNDWYMRRHLLDRLGEMDAEQLLGLMEGSDPLRLSLAYEACVFYARFQPLLGKFEGAPLNDLKRCSPLIYIPWATEVAGGQRDYWLRRFAENANRYCPLPPPGEAELPLPYGEDEIALWKRKAVHIREINGSRPTEGAQRVRPAGREEIKRLSRQLEQTGVLLGWESRTDAAISPFAVERPWKLDVSTRDGRHCLRLRGTQTGYGRGLNIHQARMSCLMEIVERCSSFAGATDGRIPGRRHPLSLHKASYEEALADGLGPICPDDFQLEAPYQGRPVSWIAAQRVEGNGLSEARVPAQLALLFSNLDEPCLTSGMTSTGLGAGNSAAESRLSALLEVLERDSNKVVPYAADRCFVLESDDSRVSELLAGMKRKGIQIQFLDITSEFGVPCYSAFIRGPGGVILKGSGAHLDGKRAALSAMTEIPYPYPYWFGATPAPKEVKTLQFEELPDYSTGDAAGDLETLERLLTANGYGPVYVDLTRKDLGLPVARAFVPGLEMMYALDRYTPLGLRQFGHYLALFE